MEMNEGKYVVPAATFAEKPDEYEFRFTLPGIGKDQFEEQA